MNGLITGYWAVSFFSVLAGLAVAPALWWAVERAWSRRGALTGTYIALIQPVGTPVLLAEIVRCRQAGASLKGDIAARARLTLGDYGDVGGFVPVAAAYRFAGRVHARQILVSYWNAGKTGQGGGMTMVLDADGTAFRGTWCGAADGQVISGPCLWVKVAAEALADLDAGQLAARADSVLRLVANPWRKPGSPPIRLDKLLDYAAARDALQRVEYGR